MDTKTIRQKAIEAYPDDRHPLAVATANTYFLRKGFEKGYKQAHEETLEQVVKFLECVRLQDYQDEEDGTIYWGELISDIKKFGI